MRNIISKILDIISPFKTDVVKVEMNKNVSEKAIKDRPEVIKFSIDDYNYEVTENVDYDDLKVTIQNAGNIIVYGWVIETRFIYGGGEFSNWSTFGLKIYQSKKIATKAMMEKFSHNKNYEVRIVAVSRMEDPDMRDYKIERILDDKVKKNNKHPLKCWKLKEDYQGNSPYHNRLFKAGTLFIQLEYGNLVISGLSGSFRMTRRLLYDKLIPLGLVNEVELKDEKWMHPHLLNEVRVKFNIKR